MNIYKLQTFALSLLISLLFIAIINV